jgi:hypothetical protein
MRKAIAVSLVVLAASAGNARADLFDFKDWYARARTVVEGLIEPRPPHNEVAVVPSPDIDPKMAVVPQPGGTMRVIPPPDTRDGGRKAQPR